MAQKWNDQNIDDQTGRVAIVTGGSSGLGLETASVLAQKNAQVIIAVRNLEKGESASNKIKRKAPNSDIKIMKLDLSDLSSITAFADKFKTKFSQLDLLINNAGVMAPPFQMTADGFELQMGTNHLGHFALTGHLIDLIKSTPESRIVNVSSMAHKMGNINFDDLNWEKRSYKKWNAYGDSKIANLYFTYALQKKLSQGKSPVIAVAAHPGWTSTKLQRHTFLGSTLNHVFAQTIPMGALPSLYAAVSKDVKGSDFIGPSGIMEVRGYPKKVASNYLSKDAKRAERLWEISESLTKLRY
ncbi:MAG: SDR family NAD(P)-dependent oxidoreductase [Desulfobacteraceae bacterium]|nr:SDR family NAD(P)-dependent oxidoreductase [Desulfobacteraceae bacterium]